MKKTIRKRIRNKIYRGPLNVFYALQRDLNNSMRYGAGCPRYAERIWVHPSLISMKLKRPFSRLDSGRVFRGDWPKSQALPLNNDEAFTTCLEHWINGVPWEQTKKYRQSQNFDKKRFEMYDQLFSDMARERRLRTRHEVNPKNFREENGVFVHVGPGPNFFFGGGVHRFAAAYILNICLPAQLGCIHIDSLRNIKTMRDCGNRFAQNTKT